METQNQEFETIPHLRMNKKILSLLTVIVRMLGLVNGTITIHARGGKLCRAVEVINRVDVVGL